MKSLFDIINNNDYITERYTINKPYQSERVAYPYDLFSIKGEGVIDGIKFIPSYNQSETNSIEAYELIVDDVVVAKGRTSTSSGSDSNYIKRYLMIINSDNVIAGDATAGFAICSPSASGTTCNLAGAYDLSTSSNITLSNNNKTYASFKGIKFNKNFIFRVYAQTSFGGAYMGAELDITYRLS